MFILNNKTDINKNINPINSEPIESKVNGMEKYLVSLNIEIIITEKIIPIIKKIIPDIPKYFNGWRIATSSIIDVITSPLCDNGFFVDVFLPVS